MNNQETTYQAASTVAVSVMWPRIDVVGLTHGEKARRRSYIGGSDANIILARNAERILDLWRSKRGEAVDQPVASLAMMMGLWTEDLNRQWFKRETGMTVSEPGLFAVSQDHDWRSATLDGIVKTRGSIWEAKHVSAFSKSEEVLARYMPQLQHNMAVSNLENAILSIFFGNHRWEMIHVAADWLYQDELLEAETRFWECVRSGEPPVALPPPPTPKAYGVREVCFEGNNRWAVAAADWLAHSAAAKLHSAATKDLKELVNDDTARAYGHSIEIKRSKAGALTIREQAA